MFEIEVDLWRWILSQALGLISLGLVIYAFQCKSKTRTLICFSIGAFNGTIATILLGNYVGAAIMLILATRNAAFAWLSYKGDKVPKSLSIVILVFFMVAATIAIYFTRVWWFDWVLMVLTVFRIYGTWRKGIHWVRLTGYPFCTALIINHIFFSNLMGVIIESFALISITIFYIRYFRSKKKETQPSQQQAEKEAETAILTAN